MQSLTINSLYKEVNMVDAVQQELRQLVNRYQGMLRREPLSDLVEQLEYWLGQYQRGSLQAMEYLTHDGRALMSELKQGIRATLNTLRDEPQYSAVSLEVHGQGCYAQKKPVTREVELDLTETEEDDEPDTYEVFAGGKTYNTFSRLH